jgi:sugar lactone lactonase YvrE
MDVDIPVDDARTGSLGSGLKRPECVLCLKSGDILVSDLGRGVTHIAPGGMQRAFGGLGELHRGFIPNGIALLPDGRVLIANMGQAGGLWTLERDGTPQPMLLAIDGVPLGATNFVTIDGAGRILVTVTTRRWPMSQAFYSHEAGGSPDGLIVAIDAGGACVIADGIAFANEIRLDARQEFLYLAETFARRIVRYPVKSRFQLGARETFVAFEDSVYPDGMAFDSDGHLWVASIISNRIMRIAPDGTSLVVLSEDIPGHLERIAQRISSHSLAREDVTDSPAKVLRNPSSLAFGGPDLRTVYIGSLSGESIVTYRSPVAGLPMPHWHFGL